MGWTFTIGIVYRHPDASKLDNFIEDLSTCITELCSSNETFFILGDISINISPVDRSAAANRYINMLLIHGVLPLITLPTRVTDDNATLTDHVFTSNIFWLKKSLWLCLSQDPIIKLDHYGIRGSPLNLTNSYFERKQFVNLNGVNSRTQRNNFGVPHGSTLGFLLFLIYINEIPAHGYWNPTKAICWWYLPNN